MLVRSRKMGVYILKDKEYMETLHRTHHFSYENEKHLLRKKKNKAFHINTRASAGLYHFINLLCRQLI